MPNLQATPTRVTETTPKDTQPPQWLGGHPKVTGVGQTTADFAFKTNEDGKVYWIVVPSPSSTPSSESIKAFTAPNQVDNGVTVIATKDQVFTDMATGLSPFNNYDAYFLPVDGDHNLALTPEKRSFRTEPAPEWVSGYPAIASVTSISAVLEVQLKTAPGKVYWCLVPNQSFPPSTTAQIRDGTCPSAIDTGSITVSSPTSTFVDYLTDLTASTTYRVYTVQEGANGNLAYSWVLLTFTTGGVDTTPPVNVVVQLDSFTNKRVVVEVRLSEPGRSYVAITPRAVASAPTPAEIKAGTRADFVSTVNAQLPQSSGFLTATGLTGFTEYTGWVVSEDTVGNLQTSVVELPFTTPGDTSPPAFVGGFPNIRNIGEKTADVVVQLDEGGKVWWCMVPQGSPAPALDDMMAGTGGSSCGMITVTAADTSFEGSAGGLTGSTVYDVYFLTEDGLGNRGAAAQKKITFETLPDTAFPNWRAGFPVMGDVQDTAAILNGKVDERSLVWAYVVPKDSAAPDAGTVKAGTGSPSAYGSAQLETDVETPIIVWGLLTASAYDAYVLLEDVVGNRNPTLTKLTFTTDNQDVWPPLWLGSYPQLSAITDTSVDVSALLSEPATFYFVVRPVGVSGNPSPASIKAGSASGAVYAGSQSAPTANVVATKRADSGIVSGEWYTVFFVAEDVTGNLQTTVAKRTFQASEQDLTPPAYETGFPQLSSITDTSAWVLVQLNEAGTFYYAVHTQGSAAPTPAAVKAGSTGVTSGSAGVPAASTTYGAKAVGLTSDTLYDVYVVSSDAAGNLETAVHKLPFRTDNVDGTPPANVAGYPRMTSITDSTGKLEMQLDEAAKVYYACVVAAASAPSAADVRDGNVPSAVAKGEFEVLAASTTYSDTVTGLSRDTAYVCYVVAEDSRGNRQDPPSAISFSTSSIDTTAPSFVGDFPKSGVITDVTAEVLVKLNEPATCAVLVKAAGDAAPTAADVTNGVGGVTTASAAVTTALELVSIATANLQPSTQYKAWLVCTDDADNVQALPTAVEFTTLEDSQPPKWEATYPRATGPTEHSVQLGLSLNKDSTVFYCLLPSGSGATMSPASVRSLACPSSALLRGSIPYLTPFTPVTQVLISVWMTQLTDYDIVMVAEDALGRLQTATTTVTYSTIQDITKPTTVVTVNETLVPPTVTITVTEPATCYYVVVDKDAAVPTSGDIKAGKGAGAATPVYAGSVVLLTPPTLSSTVAVPTSALTEGAQYKVYSTCVDRASPSNQNQPPAQSNFNPTFDLSPPSNVAGFPQTRTISQGGVTFEHQISEPGECFLLIRAVGEAAPTASSQVVEGTAPATVATSALVANAFTSTDIVVTAGLTALREYTGYIVCRDELGNLQSSISALTFITLSSGSNIINDDGGGGGPDLSNENWFWLLIVVGLLIILCVVCCCCFAWWYRKNQRRAKYLVTLHSDIPEEDELGVDPAQLHAGDWGPYADPNMGGMQGMPHPHSNVMPPHTPTTHGTSDSDSEEDLMDLEHVLQEAESVSQRVMQRPREEVQTSDTYTSDFAIGVTNGSTTTHTTTQERMEVKVVQSEVETRTMPYV